jgi:hypothetical protein
VTLPQKSRRKPNILQVDRYFLCASRIEILEAVSRKAFCSSADASATPYSSIFSMMALSSRSSLEAAGFLTAIASQLAKQGI